MKCPVCEKELEVPTRAIHNVDAYGNPVRVLTECCDTIIVLEPIRRYTARKYTGDETCDGWGASPKKG